LYFVGGDMKDNCRVTKNRPAKTAKAAILEEFVDELYCPRCERWLPATITFWWKHSYYKSGLDESKCKNCGREEKKQRRLEMQSIKAKQRPQVDADQFDLACQRDFVARVTRPIISIDREI
jgi:methionyl-tRNA synthetase